MARITISNELKDAVLSLPQKHKDRYLIRLLKKDLKLLNQLQFELLESDTLNEKQEEAKDHISRYLERIQKYANHDRWFFMEMRKTSGVINEFIDITKDKMGEISLQVFFISGILKLLGKNNALLKLRKNDKSSIYIVARVFKIVMMINKLHEDYHIEIREDVEKMGKLFGQNEGLMHTAIFHGFDVYWIAQFDIPENIHEIYKESRSNGYLNTNGWY